MNDQKQNTDPCVLDAIAALQAKGARAVLFLNKYGKPRVITTLGQLKRGAGFIVVNEKTGMRSVINGIGLLYKSHGPSYQKESDCYLVEAWPFSEQMVKVLLPKNTLVETYAP